MEGLEKDHPYSESSQQPPPAREEYAVPGVTTHRLRDRELLRKRKAEAQEKDTVQWVLGERGTSKGPKRGRGAGRRRGRQQGTEPEPQPEVQEEVEKEPPEKAQASPGHHEEEPALSVAQELSGGTQQEAVEGPPAEDTLHPAELGEAPKSEEAGISEALNIPLENDHTDNGYYPSVLF
ncbi:vegetative cell wall protein gp1-like [Platysternon megacephalum]|uniref:Vegetative cell wall protein gp1-like n=1 Tax=Platysternon megacephalum TaxID=55544 RepID=A0A4D9DKS7_9SAUR|nr:vegetative cell wall protein gp1-like [Platysternon megacephalum]